MNHTSLGVKFSWAALPCYRKAGIEKIHTSCYSELCQCWFPDTVIFHVYPRTKTCMWNIFWPEKITLAPSLPHPLIWTKWHMQDHQDQQHTHVTIWTFGSSGVVNIHGVLENNISQQPEFSVPFLCGIYTHTPTQLQSRKQSKVKGGFFTAKISLSKKQKPPIKCNVNHY